MQRCSLYETSELACLSCVSSLVVDFKKGEAQNPCLHCPDTDKLEANFKTVNGACNKLCAKHAVKAGTHVATGYTGGSYEACRCFDMLSKELGVELPHIHYLPGGGHEGTEKRGLLPKHARHRIHCWSSGPRLLVIPTEVSPSIGDQIWACETCTANMSPRPHWQS